MDLSYSTYGSGSVMVLIHSGEVDSRVWLELIPLLARTYRVVIFDARGTGFSPAPSEPINLVADLLGLLDHLKFNKVTCTHNTSPEFLRSGKATSSSGLSRQRYNDWRRSVMSQFRDHKWMIGCIVMTITLLITAISNAALHKQVNELKKESVESYNAEWYQLYRLTEMLDKYYIENNFENPVRYQLLVNQTAYHFTGRADDLSVNMRNLLVLAYDPLFSDLSREQGPLNKKETSRLFEEINDDIKLISGIIIEMREDEKEKLLDPTSSEFVKISSQAQDAYYQYIKLVDDYFKNNHN
ncbi:alpha/beta fold hydrolase [Paenibacillus lemnae]|uniref:Alpha/beta hydrolase n=1 Tax=Paenibacillus lemnae TaxID=1330551 RepID=A0A848MAA7_PAELE|nr:alpha/beta hydrolase [Paenibacillus lemnae]NMO97100.1 alpha/beta hydrolase [Paenibacillus lemnae]